LKYLLDTNPIIIALKQGFNIKPGKYISSFVTEIELLSYRNLRAGEESAILDLLQNFDIIDINDDIKQKTIDIRRKYNLKLPDSIIVATAIVENAILVSEDKQLHRISGLEVLTLDNIVS
jgi:predicted nucleic acid-binding protein